MRFLKSFSLAAVPVYPLLLWIYPVLYLWSANRIQQPAYVVVPSLLFTLLAACAAYGLTAAVLRSAQRAALAVTLMGLLVLSYGHFMAFARQMNLGWQHRYLLPISAILAACAIVGIVRWRTNLANLTRILNAVSAGLVLMVVLPTGLYYLKAQPAANPTAPAETHTPAPEAGSRDVYFILLDNYGREDFLRDRGGFDNHALVQALEERGFVFPDCAQGNYPATVQVMASILSMDYLDQLNVTEADAYDVQRYHVLAPYIQDSQVLRQFKSYGYQTVTFRGYMDLLDILNADHYMDYEQGQPYWQRLETENFQALYFRTTILYPINEQFHLYPDRLVQLSGRFPWMARFLPAGEFIEPRFLKIHQQNIYALNALRSIPKTIASPKFVYAHLYAAHWPHVIRPDGGLRLPVEESSSFAAHIDGVRYINNQILDIIDLILAESETEPVIILQGDHSNTNEADRFWSGIDRLKIFSAYYLPDGGSQLLYDQISPVNNFRLVFKHYFGAPLDLLPDRHYYMDPASGEILPAPESCISGAAP